MAQAIDIPAELLTRLAALDPDYDVMMSREDQWRVIGSAGVETWTGITRPHAPRRRGWRVRLSHRHRHSTSDLITILAASLAEALRLAVDEADRRGQVSHERLSIESA